MLKKIKKHERVVHVITLATVFGHLFCCGLPLAIAVLGLFAGLGALSPVIPVIHDALHDFEKPLLMLSAVLVALGWAVYYHGSHVDCHESGCHHPPCGTQKKRASRLLILATVLFVINMLVLFVGPEFTLHDSH
jgi:hypothetical protein